MISKAFECLQKAGLKIKLSKCSFFKHKIHYLGHLVSGTYIFPLSDKIEALMKFKPTTNIKEVRHFLSLMGCYRKFICNYPDIAHPSHYLTRKSQPFIWTQDCQSSFDVLCSHLANTPNVQILDPKSHTYCLQMQVNTVVHVY